MPDYAARYDLRRSRHTVADTLLSPGPRARSQPRSIARLTSIGVDAHGRAGVSVFRILIVDDEPDLRYILRRILERAGHEVAEAGHGAAALGLAVASPPDLVITDMMMPVMTGAELVRQLRADRATAQIPILAATGDPSLAYGADAVLTKPYRPVEILAAVNALLTEKATRR
jgi:CheY-like chemotaxis protein